MTLRKDIETDADLVNAYTIYWAERMEMEPDKDPTRFELFEPDRAKHLVELTSFRASTLPHSIRSCHRWQLRLNDVRKVSVINKKKEMTGVDVNCYGFQSVKVVRTGHTCHAVGIVSSAPEMRHSCGDPGANPDECAACKAGLGEQDLDTMHDLDEQSLASLGVNAKMWRGWRIAYRTAQPERETAESAQKRIDNKRKLSNDKPFRTDSSLSKSDQQRRESAQKLTAIRRARANSQSAAGLPAW